ncbi:MAG: DinB family protein [Acidobacteria bacterium]|nr:DinB family protein [Acidobacteriota bacterium]
MLENSINTCPDEIWLQNAGRTPYWHNVLHTLFFTDLYLEGKLDGFVPPEPIGMTELDPSGVVPDIPYTKSEMLAYLAHCRQKSVTAIGSLTASSVDEMVDFPWVKKDYLALIFYNLRHIQHHVGQLNLILRQRLDHHAPWVDVD